MNYTLYTIKHLPIRIEFLQMTINRFYYASATFVVFILVVIIKKTNTTVMKISALITCIGIGIVFFACNKESLEPKTSTVLPNTNTGNGGGNNSETFSNIQSFFDAKTPKAHVFNVSATTSSNVVTPKGTRISIPANAFRFSNGNAVSGMIQIEFLEVFSNTDMLYSGFFPISYGQVLNSGAEYYLQANQNGVDLIMNENQQLQIVLPAQAPGQNMEFFLANGDLNADSLNWEQQEADSSQANNNNSSFTFNSGDDTYSLTLDSMGWGNIDAFDWTIQYFDCTFDLTGVTGLNNTNTTAFAVFEDQNSIWPVGTTGWGSISNNTITESHLGSVAMNIVVISVVNGQLYSGLLGTTPVQNQNYTINMSATTSAALDAMIMGLP